MPASLSETYNPLLDVVDFGKSYRDIVAVDGLSFSVQPGSVLGMVGANGAGKTTTMRAIAGIIPPTSGNLLVAGNDVVRQPKLAKQQLAYVPDEPKLFETLTVWEHLEFIASAYHVNGWATTAEDLLKQFELIDRRDTLAQELSRGMRQKVAICCGYLHDPQVIMFDEPHTGLDPHAIRTMTASVAQRAAAGAAVMISSHLLSLVENMCTHLLILSQGKSLFTGTLAEARNNYPDLGDDNSLEQIFFRATLQ